MNHNNALSPEELAAAQTLHKIRGESFVALYDHLKRYNGSLAEADRALRRHASQHPLTPSPTKSTPSRKLRNLSEYERKKKDELDAGMGLLRLNGQHLTDTRAALAMMMLKQESKNALRSEKRRQEEMLSLAEVAIEKKRAADQFLALKQFRVEYPEQLRASRGDGGGDVRKVVDRSCGENDRIE